MTDLLPPLLKCYNKIVIGFLFLSMACGSPDNPGESIVENPPDRLDNYMDWGIYRGDKKANQYSELAQINAANVHRLQPVWEYRTGDATESSSMQCNPIVIDGMMYISTFSLNAIALDAETGEEVWVFKSSEFNENQQRLKGRNRGVVYWEEGEDRRIFHFVRHRVYALDAKTGTLIKSFGNGGHIDLRQHLDMDPAGADVEVTSPGIVYKNFLIVSSRVTEDYHSTPGHIRAFDTVTGEFRWIFHTIPQEGEFGYDTWEWVEGETYGGANAWGGLTVDEERGWVFCATGSPAPDFYGGYRKGTNLFGNCVLALDASTGKRQWHYQTVHHDLWDYDNPPAPVLVTIKDGKSSRDAVVQFTKMGFTFVLDRDTGEPLFPVIEIPVPKSIVPGEEAWPTQPVPLKPLPLSRVQITGADLSNVTPESREYALEQFQKYLSGPVFTPPSERGHIVSPGFNGGVEWHGGSFDPTSNVIYVNSHDAPTLNRLRQVYGPGEGKTMSGLEHGRIIYQNHCATCHGFDRKGIPPVYPSLLDTKKSDEEIKTIIRNGSGIMPSFAFFDNSQVEALEMYVLSDAEGEEMSPMDTMARRHYVLDGYKSFRGPYGEPAIAPPWGTLNAIDLTTGDIRWRVPLGEYPALVKKGIRGTGSANYGGAVATAGGIVLIAATYDEKIRAFEKVNGHLLWEYQLPYGGYATPAVYSIKGRQYVTIVAGGGGKNGTRSGDAVVTFSLPDVHDEEINVVVPDSAGWISLFNGKNLDGWVQLNGWHSYRVEDSVIVGQTVEGSPNSFLCTLQEFDDFEMEVEVWIDDVTNSGIQFRSGVRPVTSGEGQAFAAGRVYGPQAEIRRFQGDGIPTTGMFYGEALGTGWLSSEEQIKKGHSHYLNEAWNTLRIIARGPRMQTFVNGQPVDDIVNEEVYKTHPSGFIGLQVHGIEGEGPFEMKWRNIKIRKITKK